MLGRDPELAFHVLLSTADVAAVTMSVLDRPSERAIQIRQAFHRAFVESRDDKAMRHAFVARPRPWREFHVGDQVAFWRAGRGPGMRHGNARWYGRAVVLALCPGSKNVWTAYRHQLLKMSQEQLRMATVTERVDDDVIQQELRAIGENSATDGQVLPKYLDISRDPPPPSSDESKQTSLEERAERRERFENWSSGPAAQVSSAQSSNTEDLVPPEEPASKEKGSEVETSAVPRRRIAGKRLVEEDAPVHAKEQRIECN